MDDVLLLKDELWEDCHIKDYLNISKYNVFEISIQDEKDFEKSMLHKEIVILACDNARMFFDKVERIRNYTEIPIMVISRIDDEWSKIKIFQLGADDYIAGKFNEMELIARIQARIEQFRRLTKLFGYIKVKDLVIEALNRRAYIKNEEVLLTAKEFDILVYLAQHGNSAVTKEELYTAVWKEKVVDGFSNTVVTYVKKVRQKIEPDPDNPQYIETVWGIGYRFIM
ncbi:MAG: response regulator transcription factor [Lachnospiraceae bacterium]|nr:response regulator transcription factor [Lachnospiraceae bacterium]